MAKIGILGLNGSGKSTLLRIIAGVDKSHQGDVVFSPGYKVGYLEQEPPIRMRKKTVLEVVKEGVAETVAVLDEYNKINDMFGLPEVYEDADKMQKLMDKQAALQDQIDASNAWELDTKLEIAMDALRTPDPDQKISVLSGGERRRWWLYVDYCFRNRKFFCSMSPPTTWMPNRYIGWSIIWPNIREPL